MAETTEPKEDNNNSISQQQDQRKKTILWCIGCDGNKEADYVVGKKSLPLCQMHWDVYSALVLERRTVKEEQGWT